MLDELQRQTRALGRVGELYGEEEIVEDRQDSLRFLFLHRDTFSFTLKSAGETTNPTMDSIGARNRIPLVGWSGPPCWWYLRRVVRLCRAGLPVRTDCAHAPFRRSCLWRRACDCPKVEENQPARYICVRSV